MSVDVNRRALEIAQRLDDELLGATPPQSARETGLTELLEGAADTLRALVNNPRPTVAQVQEVLADSFMRVNQEVPAGMSRAAQAIVTAFAGVGGLCAERHKDRLRRGANMTELREWIEALPTDAISQVLRVAFEAENDATGADWRSERDVAFRKALLSLAPRAGSRGVPEPPSMSDGLPRVRPVGSGALRAQGGAPSFEQQVREALAAIPHTPGCFDSDYGCACNRDERVALAVVAAIDAAIDEALDAQAFRATLSWSAQAKAERPVDAGRNAALGALGAPRE